MTMPQPSGLEALIAELLQAMSAVYSQAVNDELDQDFIELYVKPQQVGATATISYRADITPRGALVFVTDEAGGVYQLPLPAVPLSAASAERVTHLIAEMIAPHPEAPAIQARAAAGDYELFVRFDTLPDRFSLVRRGATLPPETLGEFRVGG